MAFTAFEQVGRIAFKPVATFYFQEEFEEIILEIIKLKYSNKSDDYQKACDDILDLLKQIE